MDVNTMAQRNMEGFISEFRVRMQNFRESMKAMKLTKKESLRLLEKLTMFPLEAPEDEVHLSSKQSKELFEQMTEIYTVKQNLTLAYIAENSQKAAQEQPKNEIEEAKEKIVEAVEAEVPKKKAKKKKVTKKKATKKKEE